MQVRCTRDEFRTQARYLNADEITNLVEGLGIEFKPEPLKIPAGIYRRVHGVDMINVVRDGTIHAVDRNGNGIVKPQFVLHGDNDDQWICVLTEAGKPVLNGITITLNIRGERIR